MISDGRYTACFEKTIDAMKSQNDLVLPPNGIYLWNFSRTGKCGQNSDTERPEILSEGVGLFGEEYADIYLHAQGRVRNYYIQRCGAEIINDPTQCALSVHFKLWVCDDKNCAEDFQHKCTNKLVMC